MKNSQFIVSWNNDKSFAIGHVPFHPDALSYAYVIGYTKFKYGKLEDFCIDCYTKLVTATCYARYLRLVKHLGNLAGQFWLLALIYQFTFFSFYQIAWDWNIHVNWLPIECGLSINISDKFSHTFETAPKWWLVALVVPILSKCEEFKCCDKGIHSVFWTTFVCKRFFFGFTDRGKNSSRTIWKSIHRFQQTTKKKSTETSKMKLL